MAGAVLVRGQPQTKPGTLVDYRRDIALRAEDHPYVSRGALKLAKGLDSFAIDPRGTTALDVGASTGGFSDVLLQRGAARVYAIDVGHGQLAWSIRQDPRVVVLERHKRPHARSPRSSPALRSRRESTSVSRSPSSAARARSLASPTRQADRCGARQAPPQFEVGRDLVARAASCATRPPGAARSTRSVLAGDHGFVAGDDVESRITGPGRQRRVPPLAFAPHRTEGKEACVRRARSAAALCGRCLRPTRRLLLRGVAGARHTTRVSSSSIRASAPCRSAPHAWPACAFREQASRGSPLERPRGPRERAARCRATADPALSRSGRPTSCAIPPPGPVTLVVVDGTWSQARNVVRDNPVLQALPRYAFATPEPSSTGIRREPRAENVSTIEALMHVLGCSRVIRRDFASCSTRFA